MTNILVSLYVQGWTGLKIRDAFEYGALHHDHKGKELTPLEPVIEGEVAQK